MRLFFIFFTFFFFTISCFAQNSSEVSNNYIQTLVDGRLWGITQPQGMGSYRTKFEIINCDTIINDTRYWQYKYLDGTYLCAMREDTINEKIFIVYPNETIEYKIADYLLEVGDSMYLGKSSKPIYVDSVAYRLDPIQNRIVKHIYCSSYILFISGIGTNMGLFISNGDWQHVFEISDTDKTCGNLFSYIEEDLVSPLQFYPNPVTDNLYIQLENTYQYNPPNQKGYIFNIEGKIIEEFIFDNTIKLLPFQNYSSGIYFIKVGNRPLKKVIKY